MAPETLRRSGRYDGETKNQNCTSQACRGETARTVWQEKVGAWRCMRCGADLFPKGPQTSAQERTA